MHKLHVAALCAIAIVFAIAPSTFAQSDEPVQMLLGGDATTFWLSSLKNEKLVRQADVLATDQFFACDGSALSLAKWAPTNAGPFTDSFATGSTANFAKVNGTGTGGSIAVGGINATENFTISSVSGTISNVSSGVVPITVAAGKTLDFSTQSFTSSATAGYNFSGPGVLALTGNTYGGGFTINSGTVVARGINAMGGGATGTLTINGGTIAASATRDFSGKYPGGITVGGNFQLGELSANVPIASSSANLTFNNNISLGSSTRTIAVGGDGVYAFGGVISGSPGTGLTIGRSGNAGGEVILSGVNTYTGNTTVNWALGLTGSGSIANSPVIEIGPGGIFDLTLAGPSLTLATGQSLRASGTGTTGTITLSSTRSLTTSATSPLQFTAFNGTVPPLTISGAGTLALQAGNPVTVTVSRGGIPLGPGDYKLIAKGATGTVTGTPTSLTVGGDGVSGTASLVNAGGELFLHVVAGTPTITTDLTGFTGNFGNVAPNTDTAEQHYKVSGANIGVGGITVTAPAGFQVSPASGFGFSSSFTIGGSGTIAPTDVFVKFHPTGNGSFSGNVTNAATGAVTQNVAVTGTSFPILNVTNDPTVTEGNAGTTVATFNVTLSAASTQTVTVHYATQDSTATTADNDYVALPDTLLTFLPGETSKNIDVTINGDTKFESNEQFFFNISFPSNANISDNQGIGTISNDDVPATSLVVNTTADTNDGFCTPADCSLREAINAANFNADANTITFNIPGGGLHTISPTTALPTITSPVTIDGYSQPGASANTLATGSDAVLQIELDGAATTGSFVNGLTLTASNSTIKGLVINDFSGRGIFIDTGTGNTVAGNRIGTNAAGTAFKLDTLGGVFIFQASGTTVGGTTPASRNLFADGFAIQIAQADSNVITNNYFGTNADGNASVLPSGIILQFANNTRIGGLTAGERNVISGGGVVISGNNNTVEGNYLNLNAAGATQIAFSGNGIKVQDASTGNLIGGTSPGAGNVIAGSGSGATQIGGVTLVGNTGSGLFPSNNTVQGNLIGTNAAGTAAIGNFFGIDVTEAPNNTIGGTTGGARNVISGNTATGIRIQGTHASGNVVQGNTIGTAADGTTSLPNSGIGISISSTAANNTIGGTAAGAANIIAFNGQTGVLIDEFAGSGNSVVANSIFSNGNLGIDIGPSGVTSNDSGDGDVGAGGNPQQNFPVVTSAIGTAPSVTITGTLNSTPGQTFAIDLYASSSCGGSGFGQGQTYLGRQTTGTTNGTGDIGFVFSAGNLPAGIQFITATATDSGGSSSEFSACVLVIAPDNTPPDTSILTHPTDPSTSASATFTFDGTDAGGSGVAGFECSLDGSAFAACTSPQNYAGLADGSHTFQVRAVDGAGNFDLTPASFTWTINTTTIEFSTSAFKIAEGSNATITVTRSGNDLSGTSTVDYATTGGGTAAAGADCAHLGNDYITPSGTLTFGANVTSQTFNITICSDSATENPAETVNLALSSPTNASIGSQGTSTLTILDAATQFRSTDAVAIVAPGTNGIPYGTSVTVTSYPGPIGGVRVTLFGVTHANPDNLEALLVSPNGTGYVLMADTGDGVALNGATVTLEDVATVSLPDGAPGIADGINYRPASCGTPGPFSSPAPAVFVSPGCPTPGSTLTGTFGGAPGNGVWTLYIRDDGGAALGGPLTGQIGGWGLQILVPTAAPANISGQVRTVSGIGIRNAVVTVSGGNLQQPVTTTTGSFGYFSVNGLTAGQAYVVSVSARHYAFAQPVRIINLLDDVAGFDFVADQ